MIAALGRLAACFRELINCWKAVWALTGYIEACRGTIQMKIKPEREVGDDFLSGQIVCKIDRQWTGNRMTDL